MSLKTQLKDFLASEEFRRSRKLAKVRATRLPALKARLEAYSRGELPIARLRDELLAAMQEEVAIDGLRLPVWGFGGPSVVQFLEGLSKSATNVRLDRELKKALAGDPRTSGEPLKAFCSFIARLHREQAQNADPRLTVGNGICFASFLWHALHDGEVPVFYGPSHKGVRALLAAGDVADPGYASRDVGERFQAFQRILNGLRELLVKVNRQLNFWAAEAFLEWAGVRAVDLPGEASAAQPAPGGPAAVAAAAAAAGAGGAPAELAATPPRAASIVAPARPATPAAAPPATELEVAPPRTDLAVPTAAAKAPPVEPTVKLPQSLTADDGPGTTRRERKAAPAIVPPAPAPAAPVGALGSPIGPEPAASLRPPPEPPVEIHPIEDRPWYSAGILSPEDAPPPPPEPSFDSGALAETPFVQATPVKLGKLGAASSKPVTEPGRPAFVPEAAKPPGPPAKAAPEPEPDRPATLPAIPAFVAEPPDERTSTTPGMPAFVPGEASAPEKKVAVGHEAGLLGDFEAMLDAAEAAVGAPAPEKGERPAEKPAPQKLRAEAAPAAEEAKPPPTAPPAVAEKPTALTGPPTAAEKPSAERPAAEKPAAERPTTVEKPTGVEVPSPGKAGPPAPAPLARPATEEAPAAGPAPGAEAPVAPAKPAPAAEAPVARPAAPAVAAASPAAAPEAPAPARPAAAAVQAAHGPAADDGGLVALAAETEFPEPLLRDLSMLLRGKRQVILTGVTGTGKTYLARHFAFHFAGSPERVRFVQLHRAYRYEDFVEGPPPPGSTTASHGLLRSLAGRAAADPDRAFVLVLDEVGRADLVAVLGECFSLLEYRDEEVVLPFSGETFRLPSNLYLLGTLTTGAGSTPMDDAAVRRRFTFFPLEPSADLLRRWLAARAPSHAWVARLLEVLNRRLEADLGPRRRLGHSVFMEPGLDDRLLERIWRYSIRPILEGLFASDPRRLEGYDFEALCAEARNGGASEEPRGVAAARAGATA